jgi:hypothetical protein
MAAAPNITVKMLRVGMLAAFTNSNTTRSLVTEARGSMDVMDSRGKLDVEAEKTDDLSRNFPFR